MVCVFYRSATFVQRVKAAKNIDVGSVKYPNSALFRDKNRVLNYCIKIGHVQ